jgi:hypothetical protein
MLERFQEKNIIVKSEVLDENQLEDVEKILPDFLIKVLKNFGYFSTKDRFFFLRKSSDFEFLNDSNILPNNVKVFANTSFGDLFLWDSQRWMFYSIQDCQVFDFNDNLELFFESFMVNDEFLKKNLYLKEHQKAVRKLGLLEPDECFAFVPAFALGGSVRTSEIEKVKLREHLLFLSQLTGKPEFVNLNVSTETLDNLIDAYDRENP